MTYPTQVVKNQFGEQSNNAILGGSSQLSVTFKVDHANANGYGVSGFSGKGVKNVFMNTSQTPVAGNPNPVAGFLYVILSKNYSGFSSVSCSMESPVSGTPINVTTGLSVGQVYVITSVGTTTPAQWQALGLPAGTTPAVNVVFVATSATAGVGTGVVEVPLTTGSAVDHLELVGDPNTTCNPSDGSGSVLVFQILAPTSSSVTTLKPVAPVDGTIINMSISMLNTTGAQI